MPLEAIARSSVAGAVYDQLSAEILGGHFESGSSLPSERALAELLGVNRGAVREAIQRLSAAGLVHSRQGDGTRVLDFRRSGGLDLLPQLLLRSEGVDPAAIRAVAELRSCIGTDAARLAALRRGEEDRARLAEVLGRMQAALDPQAHQAASLALWEAVVDAADNIAYRLAFNSLVRAYEPFQGLLLGLLSAELEDVAGHAAVVAAIEAGQPEAAADAARQLLGRGSEALSAVASALSAGP